MTNVYSYVVTVDRGLAPNPFWGMCTLAVCTPNHMGCKADMGDWIAGVTPASSGQKLLYVMEISEVVNFDDYFSRAEFAAKKPVRDGTPEQRCGDNFYSLESNRWVQHWNPWHAGSLALEQDTRYPRVFVAERFWYLGRKAMPVPERFRAMFGGRGLRKNHPPGLAPAFKNWVSSTLPEGVSAKPRDLESAAPCVRQHCIATDCGDRPVCSKPSNCADLRPASMPSKC